MYAEPERPTSRADSPSTSGRCSAAPSEPTTVTSSPSSSQVTPSASTTRQCQRDHGSASRRAGIVLETAPGDVMLRPRLPGLREEPVERLVLELAGRPVPAALVDAERDVAAVRLELLAHRHRDLLEREQLVVRAVLDQHRGPRHARLGGVVLDRDEA